MTLLQKAHGLCDRESNISRTHRSMGAAKRTLSGGGTTRSEADHFVGVLAGFGGVMLSWSCRWTGRGMCRSSDEDTRAGSNWTKRQLSEMRRNEFKRGRRREGFKGCWAASGQRASKVSRGERPRQVLSGRSGRPGDVIREVREPAGQDGKTTGTSSSHQ